MTQNDIVGVVTYAFLLGLVSGFLAGYGIGLTNRRRTRTLKLEDEDEVRRKA